MDSVYTGAYGRLKALTIDLLDKKMLDEIERRGKSEFIPTLSNTPYREEIDAFYNMYGLPEAIEVIVNSHMMKNVRNAVKLVPTGARPILEAYMGRWDIENIRLILYSKMRNFSVSGTEAFLVVDRNMPVGTYSGFISKEEYANMIEKSSTEEVIELAAKYWYGTKLMEAINSISTMADVDKALLNVEIAYYENLMDKFRFYNGDEGPLYEFFRKLIDIRNIMAAARFKQNQIEGEVQIAKGGYVGHDVINSIVSSPVSEWKNKIPFKIDGALKMFEDSKLMSFLGTAMLTDLYGTYLPVFKRSAMSLEYVFYFIIRSEVERNELLGIWFKEYHNLPQEKAELIRMTKQIEL